MIKTDELLHSREANALKFTLAGRIVFAAYFILATIAVAQSPIGRAAGIGLTLLISIASVYFFFLIKKEKKLRLIGLGGAILDVIFLFTLIVIWYQQLGGSNTPVSIMMKSQVFPMTFLFLVINSLALRPLYPAVKLNKLFDLSFSESGTRVKTGLGLFTAHHIVSKHEGEIQVASEPGKGSIFTVILPTR